MVIKQLLRNASSAALAHLRSHKLIIFQETEIGSTPGGHSQISRIGVLIVRVRFFNLFFEYEKKTTPDVFLSVGEGGTFSYI